MQKAVFIDRDGTLIKDVPYNANIELIQFEEHAIEMLRLLKRRNFLLIIISNQSGIAKGFFTKEEVDSMHDSIQQKLLPYNIQLDAFYYCPHLNNGIIKEYAVDCNCRKPKPGLILKAATDFNISLNNSWMIGDILHDVEAGNCAGCQTILIDNGNETEWLLHENRVPGFWADNLLQAAEIILEHELEAV